MRGKKSIKLLLPFTAASLLIFLWGPSDLHAETNQSQIRVVLHAHSHASGESASLNQIATLAKEQGIRAVILTDYFQQRVSYPILWGLPLRVERKSILQYGITRYFSDIQKVNEQIPDVMLIPGAEVTPFYWWSGSLIGNNWTLHNVQKNVLVFGLEESEIRSLPTLENGGQLKHALDPTRGVLYEQSLIDYALSRGGLVVWSTPDESFGAEFKRGPLLVSTPPYDKSLLETENYSGIAVYPEGRLRSGSVGGHWDTVLTDFCEGKRSAPIWGFAEAVLHEANMTHQMGDWDNVLLESVNSPQLLLAGLKKGRFYIRENKRTAITLRHFTVSDSLTGQRAQMGGALLSAGAPRLEASLRLPEPYQSQKLILTVIRQGRIVHTETGTGGILDLDWIDESLESGKKHYYRIEVMTRPENVAEVLSNPIFVTRTPTLPEPSDQVPVASV